MKSQEISQGSHQAVSKVETLLNTGPGQSVEVKA